RTPGRRRRASPAARAPPAGGRRSRRTRSAPRDRRTTPAPRGGRSAPRMLVLRRLFPLPRYAWFLPLDRAYAPVFPHRTPVTPDKCPESQRTLGSGPHAADQTNMEFELLV